MTRERARHQYDFYSSQYARFENDVAVAIRRDVYGEDQGQQGWRTLDEQAQIIDLIHPAHSCHVLDIGCGSGGPSLALVASTGCTLTGIDVEASGIERAQRFATERGLSHKTCFVRGNCRSRLPFRDDAFDVVVCIDTVLHLGDRFAALVDWARVLRPGGRLLFTDAAVLTGAVSIEELEIRASQGGFVLVPPGLNEAALATAGLTLRSCEDRTQAAADIATRLYAARQDRSSELTQMEGLDWYSQRQAFLAMAAELAATERLSRFLYIAVKRFAGT